VAVDRGAVAFREAAPGDEVDAAVLAEEEDRRPVGVEQGADPVERRVVDLAAALGPVQALDQRRQPAQPARPGERGRDLFGAGCRIAAQGSLQRPRPL